MTGKIKCITCGATIKFPKKLFCSRNCKSNKYARDFRILHPIDKRKICPVCNNKFLKTNNIQIYCSPHCFYKNNYIKNKEKINKKHLIHYYNNKEKIRIQRKKYRDSIPIEKRKVLSKERNARTKEYRKKYWANKRKTDPIYAFNKDLSRNLALSLNRINNSKNNIGAYTIINIPKTVLKSHMENQFKKDWSFKNRGTVWDIGHRIPLNWFKTKQELIKYGWNIKNIFPVEKHFNRHVQRDKFAFINNKQIYKKEEAIKELFLGDDK